MRYRHSALALLLLFAACNTSKPKTAAQSVTVDTLPVLDLVDPDATEEPLFEFPTGGTVLSNGNIVVNDYYAAQLVYFDSAGKTLRKVGGHGQGPREFGGALTWRGQCARDSVFAFIVDRMQTVVVDSAGNIARTFREESGHGGGQCENDSQGVFWEISFTRLPRQGDPPIRAKLHVGDVSGKDLHEFGEFVIGEYGPLRARTRAVVRDGKVYVGSGQSGAIDVYSTRAKKLRTIETGAKPGEATAARFDAALDDFVSYLVLHDDRREKKERFRQMYPQPARTPAYSSFHVDGEGLIWVVTSHAGDGVTTLRIVSGDNGAVVGEAALPVELRIFEVGDDYLLGSYEDAEGFPHVALYRVGRR